MKLLGSVLVLWTLVGVISGASSAKRGAAVGLNLTVVAPTPAANPTIPSLVNLLTSQLFHQNETTGESPIYGLLKQLTSNIFPFISNTTYNFLNPLNNFINGITSNLYHGLCAPPMPKNPTGQTPTSGGGSTATTTKAPTTATNPITNIFNLLTGNSGTSATDPISQFLASLTGAASSGINATSGILSTLAGAVIQHFGNDASTIQSLISTLGGLLNGATGTTGTTSGTDPLTAILNSLGLGTSSSQSGSGTGTGTGSGTGTGTGTWTGLFPGITVTGGVNTTLNVSPQALATVLSSISQTIQSLQAALAKLGWGAQQFVNGLAAYGGNILAYLQNIFAQAASAGTWTGLFPGVSVTGGVNTTLNLSPQAFTQLLASIGETVQSLQAALNALSGTAQQFVGGLAAYQGNALAYLQAIFAQACANSTGTGGTNTLQGLLNNVLNSLNSALGGTGLVSTFNNLLTSLLGGGK